MWHKYGDVAQVSNLLYRGFLIRNRHTAQKGCRLEVGDTAGWKPALRDRRQNTSPNLRRATLSPLNHSCFVIRHLISTSSGPLARSPLDCRQGRILIKQFQARQLATGGCAAEPTGT